METHHRLAPCPAALEGRKLGPSTGIQGEKKEDREGRDHNQEGGRCLVLANFVCYLCVILHTGCMHAGACWETLSFSICLIFVLFFPSHNGLCTYKTRRGVSFNFFPHYFSLNELSRSHCLSCCRIIKHEPIHLTLI